MALNGHHSDFIADFISYSAEGSPSPELFRKWAAISLVAGALERRVWARTGLGVLYPNLYVLLVAPPGIGKFIIEEVRRIWADVIEPGTKLKAFHVSPDSMTKAALIDTLAKSKTVRLVPKGPSLEYHSLLIAAEELTVLLPTYDMEYISSLNSIFMNKSEHIEVRRYGPSKEVYITNPQLNLLAGAQPAILGDLLPQSAWDSGLMRRVIMVYSAELEVRSLLMGNLLDGDQSHDSRAELVQRLGQYSQLYGQMTWAPGALEALNRWHTAGGPPVPEHTRLQHYVRSRTMHATKLATVSAVARTGQLVISVSDIDRALFWLCEAEAVMPDIFREMLGKSDRMLMEELHLATFALFNRGGKKPVEGARLRAFLLDRAPHDKVESLILAAERANFIARVAGTQDLWMPRPRYEHGGKDT